MFGKCALLGLCLAVPAPFAQQGARGLVTGLLLYSAGTLLFWPAAVIGKLAFFLCALFVIASGLAFLETGANPFIAHGRAGRHGLHLLRNRTQGA